MVILDIIKEFKNFTYFQEEKDIEIPKIKSKRRNHNLLPWYWRWYKFQPGGDTYIPTVINYKEPTWLEIFKKFII